MTEKPRVLLAEDHQLVADGLARIMESEFNLLATVRDGEALLLTSQRLNPDIVVTDIAMPRMSGLEALRHLQQDQPWIKVLVLTMYDDVELAATAFREGASAFLLKHSTANELVAALKEVYAGRRYITSLLANSGFDKLLATKQPASGSLSELTPRQRQVLTLVAGGLSSKEIACRLGISRKTVEFHKYKIMEKLEIATTAGLIRYAFKYGLSIP